MNRRPCRARLVSTLALPPARLFANRVAHSTSASTSAAAALSMTPPIDGFPACTLCRDGARPEPLCTRGENEPERRWRQSYRWDIMHPIITGVAKRATCRKIAASVPCRRNRADLSASSSESRLLFCRRCARVLWFQPSPGPRNSPSPVSPPPTTQAITDSP